MKESGISSISALDCLDVPLYQFRERWSRPFNSFLRNDAICPWQIALLRVKR